MKNKMKAVLTLMSLTLAFTGCGSKPAGNTPSATTAAVTAENEATTAASQAENETTTETASEAEATTAVTETATTEAVTTEATTAAATESTEETKKEVEWLPLAYYGIDDFGNISGIGYEYTYDSHGNITASTGQETFTCENQYDGDHLTSVRRYMRDGSLDYEQKYTYADDGTCIEMDEYDDSGKLRYVYEYTYDNKGRKTSETKVVHTEIGIIFDYKYEWIYDEADNLVRHNWYSKADVIGTYIIYNYDEQNNPTTVVNYNEDGSVFVTTMIYHDDANAAWVYECYKGNTLNEINYYNEDMDSIKEVYVYSDGQMEVLNESTYSYDEQGYKHQIITTASNQTIERVYMPFYQ